MGNMMIHPMIVHFSIVFAVTLPVAALIALYLIHKQKKHVRVWVVPFSIALMILATGFAGMRTGKAELERGNADIPAVVEQHKQAAHRFIMVATVVAIVAAAGLLPNTIGTVARSLATAGAFAVLVSVFQVGQAGGQLAYELYAERVVNDP